MNILPHIKNLFILNNVKNKTKKQFIEDNSKYKVAFIIDDKVVDIITCNERLCAILTSSPTAIGFPSKTDGAQDIKIGWEYKDGVFNETPHVHLSEEKNFVKPHEEP